MKLWKFILFGFVALGLGFYIYEIEKPAGEKKALEEKPFSTIKKNAISSFTVQRNALAPFTIINTDTKEDDTELNGKNWHVEGINGATLDSTTLNSVVSELKNFTIKDELPAAELSTDRAVYGLNKPELSLMFKRAKEDFEIQFGKRSDYLMKRYVVFKNEGKERIFLTDEALYNTANKDLFDYRNKNPFTALKEKVSEIIIRRGTEDLGFKQDAGVWNIVAEKPFKASTKTIQEVLNALSSLSAKKYFDVAEKTDLVALFDKPIVSVTFKQGDTSKTISFVRKKVAENSDEYYAKFDGLDSFVQLAADPTKDLIKTVASYRERQYFNFNPYEVTEVAILRGADLLTLKKNNELWKVNDKDGDRVFIDDYLESVSKVEAEAFVDDSSASDQFNSPTVTVTVKTQKEEKKLIVGNVSKENANQFYTKVDGESQIFTISADTLLKISPVAEKLIQVVASVSPTVEVETTAEPKLD